MKWIKNNLANFFTLGNLACGFLAIVLVLDPWEEMLDTLPFWLMILAAVLDFFDGFIARATKTSSKIGADLDSLADMVTFGVLPGVMIWSVLPGSFALIGILIPILSAWRLAKFNNDTRKNEFFYGLATPANALMIGGFFALFVSHIGMLDGYHQFINVSKMHLWSSPIILIMSFLMVSDLKLLSNKISPFSLTNAKWHIGVLVVGIILISIFGYLGISLAIISYVLISIIANFARSKSTKK